MFKRKLRSCQGQVGLDARRSVIELYGVVRCGMVWYGMVRYGMVWYGMVWYGMVWYGMVWYGTVWYGVIRYGMYVCIVCMYGSAQKYSTKYFFSFETTLGGCERSKRWNGQSQGTSALFQFRKSPNTEKKSR
ncbi:unnamed protein product [Haemonchus placei]|uniref:Transmembrane protein n=1 Tax=Haemonchus placei TaxID=6290 RepID=A0A0N4W9V5_HAEPC|nr:unnamed protein product [Haemonchus placei]